MSGRRLLLAVLLVFVLVFPFVGSAIAAPTFVIALPSAEYALYVPGGTPALQDIPNAEVRPGNTKPWNGSLMVFAHGYTIPGSSQTDILAYLKTQLPELAQMANDRGYIFAASTYSATGYSIKEGVDDTRDLVRFIRGYASVLTGRDLAFVYVIGGSEGGLITVNLLEQYPSEFSGGVSGCGAVAGWQPMVQYDGDYRVLLDYFFGRKLTAAGGNPYPLGTQADLVPTALFEKWSAEASTANPSLMPVHSYYYNLFLANPTPTRNLVSVARVGVNPATTSRTIDAARAQAAMAVLNYVILGTADQFEKSGGNPYDNINPWTTYTDPTRSMTRTALSKLNSGVERLTANPLALQVIQTYYSPTGNLARPLVTVHNQYDPDVPYRMEDAYRSKVPWYYGSNLASVSSQNAYGHCNFTQTDMSSALFQLLWMAGDWGGIFGSPTAAGSQRVPMAVGPR